MKSKKYLLLFLFAIITFLKINSQSIDLNRVLFNSELKMTIGRDDKWFFTGTDLVNINISGGRDSVAFKQTVISSDTSFYLSTTGSDVTGNGTILLPYLTISRVLEDLDGVKISNADLYLNFLASGTYNFTDDDKAGLGALDYANVNIFFIGTSEAIESAITFTEATANYMLYNAAKAGITVTENQYRGYFVDDGSRCYPISYNSAGTDNFQVEYMRGNRGGARNVVNTGVILDFNASADDKFLEFNFNGLSKVTYERVALSRATDRIEFTTLDVFIDFTFGTKFICQDMILGQFSEHSAPIINFTGCYFQTTANAVGVSTRNASGAYNFTRSVIDNSNNTLTECLLVSKNSSAELREVTLIGGGGNGLSSSRLSGIFLSKTNIFRGVTSIFSMGYESGRILSNSDQGYNNILSYGATYIVDDIEAEGIVNVIGFSDETSTITDTLNPSSGKGENDLDLNYHIVINENSFPLERINTKVLLVNGDTIKTGGGSASPAGSDMQIQFNDEGSFGASSNLSFNDTALRLNNANNSILIGDSVSIFKARQGSEDNVVIGYGAGKGTGTTANADNVIIGYIAGEDLDGSSNNVIIGSESGKNLTNGYNNIFIGAQAARDVTTGDDNVIIGQYAGRSANISESLMIGSYAGQNSTGSGNLFLGRGAGFNETSSNKLKIGNGFGTSLIEGNFTTDEVTINDILKIAPRSAAPSSPTLGTIYVNSTDNHIYFYNGTIWVQIDN